MNVEFHYYALYALALEAGLDDAFSRRLASSSQYVDASISPMRFESGRGTVSVAVTQNYVFWDESVLRDVYLPFHFLPGDQARASALRIDGRAGDHAVTPNGELARELLVAALGDRDPWLIGIALHSFADTWAHQNFSGRQEPLNDLGGRGGAVGLPPVGHLHAFAAPDEPDRVWTDGRLLPEHATVVNRDRFREAARKIFRYLRVYQGRKFDDEEPVLDSLSRIWASPSRDERIADCGIRWGIEGWDAQAWRREAGAPEDRSALAGIRHYDKLSWARAELKRAFMGDGDGPGIPAGDAFYQSELYHWHEAALEHRKRAQAALARRGL